jgi:dihydrofolate reductase
MRKLKLQMQMTVDGLVAGPEGQLAWMTMEAGDERLIGFINHLADTSDTILMGRKMTGGFGSSVSRGRTSSYTAARHSCRR